MGHQSDKILIETQQLDELLMNAEHIKEEALRQTDLLRQQLEDMTARYESQIKEVEQEKEKMREKYRVTIEKQIMRIQGLLGSLKQKDRLEDWRRRILNLLWLINGAIQEVPFFMKKAEAMVDPLCIPPEICDFVNHCKLILHKIAQPRKEGTNRTQIHFTRSRARMESGRDLNQDVEEVRGRVNMMHESQTRIEESLAALKETISNLPPLGAPGATIPLAVSGITAVVTPSTIVTARQTTSIVISLGNKFFSPNQNQYHESTGVEMPAWEQCQDYIFNNWGLKDKAAEEWREQIEEKIRAIQGPGERIEMMVKSGKLPVNNMESSQKGVFPLKRKKLKLARCMNNHPPSLMTMIRRNPSPHTQQ
ncbi:hypothetical protein SESBI_11537 [Sesbania bispinosa]|nr:hypothetical protein SESBI_11537 [Sesbania bispinosa]